MKGPLHSAPLGTKDIGEFKCIGNGVNVYKAIEMMQPTVAAQVAALYDAINNPAVPAGEVTMRRAQYLSREDLQQLERHKIVERVTLQMEREYPTQSSPRVFTVWEEKPEIAEHGGRRRLITHDPSIIDLMDKQGTRKKQIVPAMEHISAYRNMATAESGNTRDGRCAFFQVRLTKRGRSFRRFIGPDGALYQMCVLEMGHPYAPILMHAIYAVIAGHRDVVPHQLASRTTFTTVWIDGYCHAGTKEDVRKQTEISDARAKQLGVVLKSTAEAEKTHYDFIGMHVNHESHTVVVAEKTAQKLRELHINGRMRAEDIEAFIGRSYFAASITGLPVASYFQTLKLGRHVTHAMNRLRIKTGDYVEVPELVQQQMREWREKVLIPCVPPTARKGDRTAIIFVDATLTDFGAIVIMPTGQMYITGGLFNDQDATDITIADREGQALAIAFTAFAEKLQHGCDKIEALIDNTVAQHTFTKGIAKTEHLAGAIADVLTKTRQWRIPLRLYRITSEENPADEPSRRRDVDNEKLQNALVHHLAKRATMRPGVAGRVPFEL